MNYIADRFAGLSDGLALDAEAVRRYPDLIDLSIGDTDFITDSRIIDAAMADARRGYTRYGFPQGDPELIDAVCKAWAEDFGQAVSPDEVMVTASSCLGMALVCMAVLNPGDEVLVPAPYFSVYRQQIEMAGGCCIEVPTYEQDGYQVREDLLRQAVSPRTRALILNNPNNPTGAAYSADTLMRIGNFAREYDLLIIADEIYTRYLYEGEFIPMRTLPGLKDRVITLNSFSKNFMMTGWRGGVLIAPPVLRQVVQSINGAMIYTAPSVSQRAALEALKWRDEIQRDVISQYRHRMDVLSERIAGIPWMTLCKPRGTFYLFPGIEKTGLTDTAFCQMALEKAHVLLSPGHLFGSCGQGHIRIAATQPLPRLEEAMDRLSALSFPG